MIDSDKATPLMTSAILHILVDATARTASHPDPAVRFWMGVGLLCSLSLQNDYSGIFIAADAVDLSAAPDEFDVPIVRSESGEVTDILHDQAGYADHAWVEVAREIALITDPEVRLVALEAACLRLLVDRDDLLSDLLEKLKGVRHGSLGAEAIDPVREGHWRKSTGVATAPSTS